MGLEIEYKFLVTDVTEVLKHPYKRITQGYLCVDPERTVRVRCNEVDGFLTIKGKSNGPIRSEFEYSIPREDALEMLALHAIALVTKNRYRVGQWDVDVFTNSNEGLVLAEIEVPSVDFVFERPSWLGEEVTNDFRYSNTHLGLYPYSTWGLRG